MITAQISLFALYAARVILILLVFLSVLTVGFFIERIIFFRRNFIRDREELFNAMAQADSREKVLAILKAYPQAETALVLKALAQENNSRNGFIDRVNAYLRIEKEKWERFTVFLGSVGSNAPFIGLLGTVLGILKSFADLALIAKGGQQVVMAGISEALVATAVGLLVAIPAIVFFNMCKSRVKKGLTNVESLVDLINAKNLLS